MNRLAFYILVALLGMFQLACERPPPEIERFSVEPHFACPGAALTLNAIILNGQGFTYQFVAKDTFLIGARPPRVLQVGSLSGSPEYKGHDTRFCSYHGFCVQILAADETVIAESCDIAEMDRREREDRLVFGSDCPEDPAVFRPIDYPEDGPEGSRVITALRNRSRYNVILTHVGLDGIPVTERAEAGQPFETLVGSNLYGSWSVVVDDARYRPDLIECSEPGRIRDPRFVAPESIEMEMGVRCDDSSPACAGL